MSHLSRAGFFKDGAYYYPVRVYYEDTDVGGVVYYANYLKFAERARTEMLRQIGIAQNHLRASTGIAFVVRRCVAEYMSPAELDDDLTIITKITSLGGASFECEQWVENAGKNLVRMSVQIACVDINGRVHRLPAKLRALLANMSLQTTSYHRA